MRPAHISLAVAVAAIWGLNFVIIDVGLDDFPPLLLSAMRYALASLPLLILRGSPGVPWRWVFAVGIAIGVVKFSLLFIGMDVGMPAGLASLVLQAQALFTVVFAAIVLRERLVASQAAGLAIAFSGLALVATGLNGQATPTGFVLVIAAAVAWGVGNLAIKRAAPPDAMRFMSWMCLVPPLPLLCLSLAFEGPAEIGHAFAHVDLGGIGAVLYLAFAATTVGWALWARLMGLYPASMVAPFALLVPIFGIGFAAALLSEPVGARELIAAVLVLGGVLLTLTAPRPAPREAISPQLAATS
jgi:O-acetylserine/cysteine efflux transporter